MSIKILMPALSPTMTEGNLQKWLVKVGDKVSAGDVLAEIETDKATMEVEAVDEGKITNILVKEGTEHVAVNTTIAILNGSKNEKYENLSSKVDKDSKKNHISENTDSKILKKENTKIVNQNFNRKTKILASPLAKKLAKKNNIDLSSLKGSGPGGRIVKIDFENLDKRVQEFFTTSKYSTQKPSSMRKIIAERTTKAKNNIPHFYLTIESNVDKLLKLRKQINQQYQNTKISVNDIFVKALSMAQKMNPESNVSWINNQLVKYSSVDVSLAVALKEGLVTPIIKNTDLKGLLEISIEIKELVNKAKSGKLLPEDYNGGTISISNLGMYGISEFTAIISEPQSMILAIGSIQKKLILEDGNIRETNIVNSTLSVDHRALDGATAAKFLKDFNDILENPFNIWLQSKDLEIK